MKQSPVVIFFGSRTWTDENLIGRRIALLPSESILIHGGAEGADSISASIARDRGDLYVVEVRPLWSYRGKRAGHARNDAMRRLLPDPSLEGASWMEAFWDGRSPGTREMIRAAKRDGYKLHVYRPDGSEEVHDPHAQGVLL